MGLREAQDSAGPLGRYQVLHFSCIIFVGLSAITWNLFLIVFQGYPNPHHCKVAENVSLHDAIPTEVGPDGVERLSQCEMYAFPGSTDLVPCDDGWEYDPVYFTPGDGTLVMEWDLVCSQSNFVEIAITLQTLGMIVGTFVCSPLGDKVGRKRVLFICLLVFNTLSIVTAFVPSFVWFCVLNIGRGIAVSGTFTNAIVLATELFPKNLYSLALPCLGLFSALVQAVLVLIAYFLRSWRELQLVSSIFSFVFMLYYWWCPESLRWCLSKGRVNEAKALLHRQARMNGCVFDEKLLDQALTTAVPVPGEGSKDQYSNGRSKLPPAVHGSSGIQSGVLLNVTDLGVETAQEVDAITNSSKMSSTETPTITSRRADDKSPNDKPKGQWATLKSLLHTPKLLLFLGVLSYISFMTNLSTFGLVLLQASMSGSIYTKMLINSVVGVPGSVFSVFLMRRFGRKKAIIFFSCMTALHFVISAVLTYISGLGIYDLTTYSTWIAVTARTWISGQLCTFTVFGQELAPTPIRSTSFGMQTGFGFVGTILAPFIAISLLHVSSWLPTTLFGGISLIGVFLVPVLPETLGRGLPSTLEQIINYPRNLTHADQEALRKLRKRESIFGKVNKGYQDDEETARERPGTDDVTEYRGGIEVLEFTQF